MIQDITGIALKPYTGINPIWSHFKIKHVQKMLIHIVWNSVEQDMVHISADPLWFFRLKWWKMPRAYSFYFLTHAFDARFFFSDCDSVRQQKQCSGQQKKNRGIYKTVNKRCYRFTVMASLFKRTRTLYTLYGVNDLLQSVLFRCCVWRVFFFSLWW